jgi:exodeoxyribonuclease VIII
MDDVMLDLETMGNGPDAAIVAIGAVEFDLKSGEIGERFYAVIDLESSVEFGGVMDAETVLWWLKQTEAARAEFSRGGAPIADVLCDFARWLHRRGEDVHLWGNGANFDNVILASAYRRMNMGPPWEYWNDRCYRTMKGMVPDIRRERLGTKHNAADDAETQARHLIRIMARLEWRAA